MARHHCLSCNEPFERPEFFSYILRLRSKTVVCIRCQDDNYVVPNRGGLYFVCLLISILAGLAIFAFVNIGFAFATYNPNDDSFRISYLALAGGIALGLGFARLIMNILNWNTGTLSQDRKYKSAADYE